MGGIVKFEALFGTIGSAVISLVCWCYDVNDVVPIRTLFAVIIISFAVLWGCAIIIYQFKNAAVEPFFKVIKHEGNSILFQTNLHELLSVGSYVSLYKKENGFSRFTGLILIENIMSNVIQGSIKISKGEKLEVNDENIIIKPILRMGDIEFLYKQYDGDE